VSRNWNATDLLLACSWPAPGLLLPCSWLAIEEKGVKLCSGPSLGSGITIEAHLGETRMSQIRFLLLGPIGGCFLGPLCVNCLTLALYR